MKQQNPIFEGAAVAIVTPFRDGRVDYEALMNIEMSYGLQYKRREAEFRLLQEPAAMTRLMRLNCQRMPTKPAQMHCCL